MIQLIYKRLQCMPAFEWFFFLDERNHFVKNEEKIESTRGGGRYGGDEIRDREDTNGVCNDEEACTVARQEGQGVAPGSEPRNGACAVLERAHVCRWRR